MQAENVLALVRSVCLHEFLHCALEIGSIDHSIHSPKFYRVMEKIINHPKYMEFTMRRLNKGITMSKGISRALHDFGRRWGNSKIAKRPSKRKASASGSGSSPKAAKADDAAQS